MNERVRLLVTIIVKEPVHKEICRNQPITVQPAGIPNQLMRDTLRQMCVGGMAEIAYVLPADTTFLDAIVANGSKMDIRIMALN